MMRLDLEEKGLLRALERAERGDWQMPPTLRFGLTQRGLIEGEPAQLSMLGARVLRELRLRSLRGTNEVPAFRVRLR